MSRKTLSFLILSFATIFFCGCSKQKSLDQKALEDAREFNRRYCPTPAVNYIRTDSINFNPQTHLFTYNCSFCGPLDNAVVVEYNKQKILNVLGSCIKESTSMKTYIESGYHFKYVCHSDSLPQIILLEAAF